jgi:hypothetical protein
MNNSNKIYYNLSECTIGDKGWGEQVLDILWDKDFTSKERVMKAYEKALRDADKGNRVEIMVFEGCRGDEHAYYTGDLIKTTKN